MSSQLTEELENLLNQYSQENGSDTPDFILATYLINCLGTFNKAVNDREQWYGRLTDDLPKVKEHKTHG